ncbi:monocyte chemotactic protein 1B-like [Paramisgurnus dabryanus]|uniref:monocyte chemotactic protein 1B-like n=1 Tax=Paramisgurnus dabryanus TaxID=90735 RepID=UPI003CCF1559
MKNLMSLLLLGLFCSFHLTSNTPFALVATQLTCCSQNVSNIPIPVKKIRSYSWTSSSCPEQHVVFQTVKGREICADPKTQWVRRHIAKEKKKTRKSAAKTLRPLV